MGICIKVTHDQRLAAAMTSSPKHVLDVSWPETDDHSSISIVLDPLVVR